MSEALNKFLQTLDPRIAKTFKTAQETKNELLPLASLNLTNDLNGGIGRGRITIVYGNPSAGKTALMQQSMGMWQDEGKVCAFVDAEGTWDNDWAKRLGADPNETILIRKKSASKIFNELRPLLEGGLDAVILDSMSAIMPDGFINDDGSAKDLEHHVQIGAQSKAIARLINAINYSNERTAIVIISQTTTEFGQTYTKQVPHGGKKPLFAASQVIKLTSSSTPANKIKGNIHVGNKVLEVPVGRKVDSLVEKNKLGPEGLASSYDFYFRGDHVGVDHVGEAVDEAIKYGMIVKSGGWFNKGDQKWQGRDKVIKHFREASDERVALIQETEDFKNGTIRQDA